MLDMDDDSNDANIIIIINIDIINTNNNLLLTNINNRYDKYETIRSRYTNI